MKAPFLPRLKSLEQLEFFEEEFVKENPRFSIVSKNSMEIVKEYQEEFKGFDYIKKRTVTYKSPEKKKKH